MSTNPTSSEPDSENRTEWTRARIREDPDRDWQPPRPERGTETRNEHGDCTIWNSDIGRRRGTVTAWVTSSLYIDPERLHSDAYQRDLPRMKPGRGGGDSA